MSRIRKHTLAFLAVLLISTILATIGTAAEVAQYYQPGRVLILTDDGVTPTVSSLLPDIPFSDAKNYENFEVQSLAQMYPIRDARNKASRSSMLSNLYVLSFPDSVDVFEIIERAGRMPGIRYIEPDYRVELFEWPTDSLFDQQWYMRNTGQGYYAIERKAGNNNDSLYLAYGTPGMDIGIEPVYDNLPPDAVEVLVAIIDTGVDYEHPDLAPHIFYNEAEIPDNEIDDDHNGLIDDHIGWDFSGNSAGDFGSVGDNDPLDDDVGHGTHVAGLVAAVQNQIGIAGYPGNLKILPIKIFPRAFQSVTVPAILYAVEMGAKVINLSWGSPFEMEILHDAIIYARERGCLPVAAVGNSSNSLPMAPAAFVETFTVGGTNSDGYMTYFSSFGPFLNISAPAQDILSLRAANTDLYGDSEPGLRIVADKYIIADGTSMASPIVAGAAAMLWSFNPGLTPERIIDALQQTAIDITDPWNEGDFMPGYDTLSGWGRLDIGAAFNYLQAPSAYITSPVHMQAVTGTVVVGIATTGGYTGPAQLYRGQGLIPQDWVLVHETAQAVDDPAFYTWSSSDTSGYFSFRLVSDAGVTQVDFRVINGNGVRITSPLDDDTVLYYVPISGTAYGSEFDSVVISYCQDGSSTETRIFAGPAIYFDEYITDWLIARIAAGHYYLIIRSFTGLETAVDSTRVYIKRTMKEGFPKSFPGFIGFSPGVADIDGDGFKEIVVGTTKGIYAFNHDGTAVPGFPTQINKDMRSIPAFDDVDGDGLLDIIMSGDSILGCYNYLGQSVAGWPNGASTGMTYFTYPIPVATRLYNAVDSAAIYMSRLGEVHAYKYDGDPYFYSLGGLFTSLDPNIFDTSNNAGLAAPFVTTADLEPDGAIEVIGVYGTAIDKSGIFIWNSRNGLPPAGWLTPQARNIQRISGGTIADIDDNGSLEIIAVGADDNYTQGVYVIAADKSDVPGWPVQLPAVDGWIGTSPVCVDIDGDGDKEILAAFYNWDFAHVYVFNHDGTPYRENPVYLPEGLVITAQNTLGHLVVADIDGNGTLNIISRGGHLLPFSSGYEKIYVWEIDGTPTPGFPIITPTSPLRVFSTPNTPVIDDIDGDGKVDVLLCGDWDELFVWSLDAPYHQDGMPWPKYMGDEKNSGINPDRGIPTDVDDDQPVIPRVFAISDNYPNPFNPATTIRFTIDRAADIRLEVFNILGQKVAVLATGSYPAGSYEINWKGDNVFGEEVASGVYFARLTGNGNQSTRKMILMR